MKILAEGTQLGPIGGEGLGPFGNFAGKADPTESLRSITKIISSIIGVMTIAAAVWFLFQIVVGGFNWITAGGDKSKLSEARDRITHAFAGLIIVVAGWSILALLGTFFGYNILIDPGAVIGQLEF